MTNDELDDIWKNVPEHEQVKYNEIMEDDAAANESGAEEVGILVLSLTKILIDKKLITANELKKTRAQIVAACDQQNAISRDELTALIRQHCPKFSEAISKILGCEDWDIET